MSEIKFPPDVPYRAVTDKIKIVKTRGTIKLQGISAKLCGCTMKRLKKEKQS